MKKYLGIDLGGTNIAIGVVDENGNILHKDSVPTKSPRTAEEIFADMTDLCFKVVKDAGFTMDDITAVGLGSPGSINDEEGIVSGAFNLGIINANARKLIQEKINKPVKLENDANVAAVGEYTVNGKDSECFVFITLGTGVGGGIILNGQLYTGFNHAGGELGHIVIDINGKPCTCGMEGCWEAYASVTALISQTKEAMEKNPDSMMHQWVKENGKVSGRTAFECAKKGDKAAQEVVDNYRYYIGVGLVSLINIFQPNILSIGGGISAEGDYLLNPIIDFVNEKCFYKGEKRPQLKIATLKNDAGIIGAAMCAAKEF